jgi:hypothetical protein
MSLELRLALIFGLIALAVSAGLLWRARSGKSRRISNGEKIDLAALGVIKDGQPVTQFGKKVTFLQFSSEFCTACAQTSKLYISLAPYGSF